MNTLRSTAISLAACAVGLSLAACGAAGPAKPAASTRGRPVSSSATATATDTAQAVPGCGISGGTVTLDAPIGSFPVPPRAQVIETVTQGKMIGLVLSSVTASEMLSFYNSALPRAGYKISSSERIPSTGNGPGPTAVVAFTGRGYEGGTAAASSLAKMPSPPHGSDIRVCPGVKPSSSTKNIVWISLNPH